MRVAFLSANPLNSHGWGRYSRELITALTAQGIEIVLITSTEATAKPDLPVAAYHRVLPSLTPAPRFSSLRLLAAMPTISRLIAGCDVVHVAAEPYALAVPFARRLIVTAHGTYIPHTAGRSGTGALYRSAYQRAKIISVSSYTDQQVKAVLPGTDSVVIPNGVDVERYRQPAPRPDKHGPTILAVGQAKPRKGLHILAQAMGTIRQAVPDAETVFIGDDSDVEYRRSIDEPLASVGLTGAVRWLGRVSDETLRGWYQTADVFALPAINVGGKFEGFGLVYLEANAVGLPAIGTLDCGAEDAIRDGETGYLIPQNDPSALADVAIRLLRDPDLRRRMGSAARTWAEQNTWEQVARRVVKVYSTHPIN
jgi:phosphatidyl-myo-inositol dimannoside synthase